MATAPDLAPAKQMEKHLECSLCLETLKEPKTLGCFHSFCKHCLARYVEAQRCEQPVERARRLFHCPLCRTRFELRQGEGVERLPTNHFIKNMLEILAIQQQAAKLPCESCIAQVPAESRCVDCERFLCKSCLKVHNNWPDFKDHVVLTLEELAKPENQTKATGKPRCKKKVHGNKHLKFYCNTCQKLVCNDCVVLDHPRPDHEHRAVHEVAAQRKEALKNTSAMLQKKSTQFQNELMKLERVSQVAKASAKNAKDVIVQQEKEILEEFTAKLKRQTAALIGKVDKKYNDVNQKLVKQQNEMKGYVEKVNGSLNFAQNIIEKGSDEEIISLEGDIVENSKKIKSECPKMMDPVPNCFFEYQPKSTKSILEALKLNDLGKIAISVDRPEVQRLCATSAILEGNINYAKQLADWVENRKFSWILCYRASQDGWSSRDFHGKCDDAGLTVTLVKCGANIFGGYTDQSWKPTAPSLEDLCYKHSDASFLFSLHNKDGLPPFKCPIYHHKKDKAIYSSPFCGAAFGDGFDLFISHNANTNQLSRSDLGHTYQPPPGYQPDAPQTRTFLAGSYEFKPTEIEVFHR